MRCKQNDTITLEKLTASPYLSVFIVQFLFLSLAFGIPMMLFFCSMGQYLGSGIIDMWRISPIFQGIGVALMLAQGVYSVYNIAAISWMFIYFRDSFITAWDRYRWSFCFSHNEYGRNCESPVTSSNRFDHKLNIPKIDPDAARKKKKEQERRQK